MKLFDAYCHLQDPRILNKAPKLISTALDSGVLNFAVNGVSEKDWHLVKEMGDKYVAEKSPSWFSTLREFFDTTPSAAVGEIGLDKGSKGKEIDFNNQIEVFHQQLEIAKELKKPASVHCVRAFGSAEMVPEFAKSGAYFSLSGYIMYLKAPKAKKMLKAVPFERILLESDAPDALTDSNLGSLFLVDEDPSLPQEIFSQGRNSASNVIIPSDYQSFTSRDASTLPKYMLNNPANIHNVFDHVATLLEISTRRTRRIKL